MNKYKLGFESSNKELVIENLPTIGEIPSWLTGTLLRTGPVQFETKQKKLNHWFDGFSMLHSFTFNNGKVSYRNKFLQSDAYKSAQKNGEINYREFATDPCRSIFKKFFTLFSTELTDNGNVNITKIANEYLALSETTLPISFNPNLLNTKEHFKFDDNLKGQITTAHPHFDFETQEGFNYITNFSRKSCYQIYKFSHNSKIRKLLAKIEVDKPSYMHSFGLTKNYVILVEWPFVVNPLDLVFSNQPFIKNYKWEPQRGLKFRLINRNNGKVTTLTSSEVYFAFHHINAFEKGNEIMLDICAYKDPNIINALYLDKLREDIPSLPKPSFRRFTLNLENSTVISEQIINEPIELPRLNYGKYNTKPYQFAYGASYNKEVDFLNQLIKVDIESKKSIAWYKENLYPGEPVFIPRPNAQSEDDGVILSVALDTMQSKSALVILNAKDFKEIGRVLLPHHIPFGFHGNFYKS
ncbi:MAG TPA: carotenoid oxygenase family protein [Candidatus Paceibacterota bacterium]|jgi:carotenoid cleavage dioxygenase-like enzyme|nr:carotenoid oxygenase family protein [Candidatus Paceibacterota bacterium]